MTHDILLFVLVVAIPAAFLAITLFRSMVNPND